jgi:NAD-dependent SIR2 family protein deacetylase
MIKLALGQFAPDEDRLQAAHEHCSLNRVELQSSATCGCFYCFAVFAPAEISEWTDNGQTALCPKCPVDSVIGSASGFPITPEFLHRMHDRWF